MTITHEYLISCISQYVQSEYFKKNFFHQPSQLLTTGEKRLFRSDHQDSCLTDYEAFDLKKEIYIIGEAKTTKYPLSDKKSKVQLDIYLEKLRAKKNPHLIYAVPCSLFENTSQTIIRAARKNKINMTLHVITGMEKYNEVTKI